MKSAVPPVRIHLTVPGEGSKRTSFDLNSISSLPSTVILSKNKLSTQIHNSLSTNFDDGQRTAVRLSSVSSSYAQFLKQRDMDKVKKIVSHSINKVSYIYLLFHY